MLNALDAEMRPPENSAGSSEKAPEEESHSDSQTPYILILAILAIIALILLLPKKRMKHKMPSSIHKGDCVDIQILDGISEPIKNVEIELNGKKYGYTDNNGNAALPAIQRKTKVVARKNGFEPLALEIKPEPRERNAAGKNEGKGISKK